MDLQIIENKIYEIREQQVMLDFDLAEMYGLETKRLKESVRRNIERFPDDFMFQLSKTEWDELVANCDQLPKNLKHSYKSFDELFNAFAKLANNININKTNNEPRRRIGFNIKQE